MAKKRKKKGASKRKPKNKAVKQPPRKPKPRKKGPKRTRLRDNRKRESKRSFISRSAELLGFGTVTSVFGGVITSILLSGGEDERDPQGALPSREDEPGLPINERPHVVDLPHDHSIFMPALKGVKFVTTHDALRRSPWRAGIDTREVGLLNNDEFRSSLKPFIDKGVSMETIREMLLITNQYSREKGRQLVAAIIPGMQDIGNGNLQIHLIYEPQRLGKNDFSGPRHLSIIRWVPPEQHGF